MRHLGNPIATAGGLILGAVLFAPAARADREVTAAIETDPVSHSGDAADDPAIWVHPSDPALSLVIGTDKDGALEVYNLAGDRLQGITGTDPNNVDLRGNLVVTADDEADVMRFYEINPSTRGLTDIGWLDADVTEHGICMYESARTGRLYVFPNSTSGWTVQWEVWIASGQIAGNEVRGPWRVSSGAIEGCVADDANGHLYIAEEDGELWRYGAEPTDSTSERIEIASAGDGDLVADVEGLALADGYLIASSQGDDSFHVYRTADGAHLERFEVISGSQTDGCSHTDGIDATSVDLGPAFPSGLFVCQDDSNGSPASGNQNFKLVPLERILPPDTPPPPPGDGIQNPGFEEGEAGWTATDLVITNDAANAHSGSWYAWLCAYGEPHTDTLAQQVTVPDVGTVALTFWLDIDSEETTSSTAYDTLEVQIVTEGDTITLATYSNLDETNGYVHEMLDLSAFAGQTVTLRFEGTEDISLATGFQIDDLAFATN